MAVTLLRTLPEKVDPRQAALIVVDVQNDFCAADGWFARAWGVDVRPIHAMVPNLARLIDEARAASVLVVFIQATYDEKYLSPQMLERMQRHSLVIDHCLEGTWGADFFGVQPQPGDLVINKHRYSAFMYTDLEAVLKARGIQTIIVTGVATNVCCESTARDGYMIGYYVVFVSDCNATYSDEMHEATLKNIGRNFGVVATAGELIGVWQQLKVPAAISGQ